MNLTSIDDDPDTNASPPVEMTGTVILPSTPSVLPGQVHEEESLARTTSSNSINLCVACMDAPPERSIATCGHEVLCDLCADRLLATRAPKCPVCREPAIPSMVNPSGEPVESTEDDIDRLVRRQCCLTSFEGYFMLLSGVIPFLIGLTTFAVYHPLVGGSVTGLASATMVFLFICRKVEVSVPMKRNIAIVYLIFTVGIIATSFSVASHLDSRLLRLVAWCVLSTVVLTLPVYVLAGWRIIYSCTSHY